MHKIYYAIPLLYIFYHLTAFAMADLLGMGANIFAFIILMAMILGFDFAADHLFHYRLQFFRITRAERKKLSLYAFVVWIVIDSVMTALDMATHEGYTFADYIDYVLDYGLFIGASVMCIAVWFSLGYVLPQSETKNDLPDEQIYLKTRWASVNIADRIKQEKEKIKDEYPE